MNRFSFIFVIVFIFGGVVSLGNGYPSAAIFCYLGGAVIYALGVKNLMKTDEDESSVENMIREKLKSEVSKGKPAEFSTNLAAAAKAFARLSEGAHHRIPWYDKALSQAGIIAFLAMAATSVGQFFSQDLIAKQAAHEEKRLNLLNDQLKEKNRDLNMLAAAVFTAVRKSESPDWSDTTTRHRQICALAANFYEMRQELTQEPTADEFRKWATIGEQWGLLQRLETSTGSPLDFPLAMKTLWFQDKLSDDDVKKIMEKLADGEAIRRDSSIRSEIPSYICYLLNRDRLFRKQISQASIQEELGIQVATLAASVGQPPDQLVNRIKETSDRLITAKVRYSSGK